MKIWKWLALCLIFLLFFSCVSKSKYIDLETELSRTEAQLEEGRQKNANLQDRNRRLSNTVEDLKLELALEKLTVQQKESEISELDKTRREIESSLEEQIEQRDIKIEEIEGKLKVTFVDKILFDSGSVRIKQKGKDVLLKLAESFKNNVGQKILVEGHTDDVQIGSALQDKFPSNWELSAARATAVVRFLQEKGNIAPERLTASGFSYFRPVAPNDTEEGRSENRRIEIVLLPEE